MTTIDQFHDRVRRNVNDLTPAIAAAYLAGLTELLALIEEHRELLDNVEGFIAVAFSEANLNLAFARYRAALIDALRDSMRFTARAIPGMTAAQVSTIPNILDAHTMEVIRELDRVAMQRIADEIRATARETFRQGGNERELLANLKQSVGLGPNQVADLQLFHATELTRDPPLTAAQIERSVIQFSERRIAANAATVARTSALMAHKQANDLAWAYAEDAGLVPDGMALWKQWVQIPRKTRRLSHSLMDGEKVLFAVAYSNGQMIPGIGPGPTIDFNCGCVSRVTIA